MQLRFDHALNRTKPDVEIAEIRHASKRWEDTEVLSRGQLIEQILELNAGASLEFLDGFGADELSQYLNSSCGCSSRGPGRPFGSDPAIRPQFSRERAHSESLGPPSACDGADSRGASVVGRPFFHALARSLRTPARRTDRSCHGGLRA